jgi:hypothetical protein
MIFKSFAKKFNFEFKIEVNNFPTQLISVIARKLLGSDGFPLFVQTNCDRYQKQTQKHFGKQYTNFLTE